MDRSSAYDPLAQIPLARSPYDAAPAAVTLPYSYTSARAAIPSSANALPALTPLPRLSTRIAIATPIRDVDHADAAIDLLSSDTAIDSEAERSRQMSYRVVDAESAALAGARERWDAWEASVRARELAKARRLAPGFLDTGVTMLQPQNAGVQQQAAAAVAAATQHDNFPVARSDGAQHGGVERAPAAGADLLAGLKF